MWLLSPKGAKSDSPGWKRSATPGNLITTHLHHAIRKHKNILTAKTPRAQRKTRNPAFSAASLRTWRLRGKNSLLPPISVFFRVRPWLKCFFFCFYLFPCLCFCFFREIPCHSVANASAFSHIIPWLMLLLLCVLGVFAVKILCFRLFPCFSVFVRG